MFQFNRFSGNALADLGEGTQLFDGWLDESSAVHMARVLAKQFESNESKRYYNSNTKQFDQPYFFPETEQYYNSLHNSQLIIDESLRVSLASDKRYEKVGFFSYLAATSADKDSIMWKIADHYSKNSKPTLGNGEFILNDVLNKNLSQEFIDYSIHAYLRNQYPLAKAPNTTKPNGLPTPYAVNLPKIIPVNLQYSEDLIPVSDLPCLSAEYLQIQEPQKLRNLQVTFEPQPSINPFVKLNVSMIYVYTEGSNPAPVFRKVDSLAPNIVYPLSGEPKLLVFVNSNSAWGCPDVTAQTITAKIAIKSTRIALNQVSPATQKKADNNTLELKVADATPADEVRAMIYKDGRLATSSRPVMGIDLTVTTPGEQTGQVDVSDLPPGDYTIRATRVFRVSGGLDDFHTAADNTQVMTEESNEKPFTFRITADDSTATFSLLSVEPTASKTDLEVVFTGKGFTQGNYDFYFTDFNGAQTILALPLSITDHPDNAGIADISQHTQLIRVKVPHEAIRGPVFAKHLDKQSNAIALKVLPNIESVSPEPTCKDCTITVTGSGFQKSSVLMINGVKIPNAVIESANKATAVVPPDTQEGPNELTHKNPDSSPSSPGGGDFAGPFLFHVVNFNVASMTPATVFAGSYSETDTPNQIQVCGFGLNADRVSHLRVMFPGTTSAGLELPASTIETDLSGKQCFRLNVLPDDAVSGPLEVKADLPDRAYSKSFELIVKPHIESMTPTTGSDHTVITLTGTGFWPDPNVGFGTQTLGKLKSFTHKQVVVKLSDNSVFQQNTSLAAKAYPVTVNTSKGGKSNAKDFSFSPLRAKVILDKNTLYTHNGTFWRDVSIQIRNDQGQAVPAGTTIYVSSVGIGTMVDPSNSKSWSKEGAFTTGASGKIRFRYTANSQFDASRYGSPWPNLAAPGMRFRVCSYYYRSSKPGWGGDCKSVLFPLAGDDPMDGRIFFMGPASAEIVPSPVNTVMDGGLLNFTLSNVKDKEGNLVPDGTAIYVSDPYWSELTYQGNPPYIKYLGPKFVVLSVSGGSASFDVQKEDYRSWCFKNQTDVMQVMGNINSNMTEPLNMIGRGTIYYTTPPGC